MSQLKAKQLKLPNAGDLLIGGTGGTGTTIAVTGHSDKILRVVAGAPAWSVNDNLKSANTFNTVTATNGTGIVLEVENDDASGKNVIATFVAGADSDESFNFSTAPGELTLAATGTADDIDVVISAKGDGEVIIGSTGDGVIQADDGFDLSLKGGVGAGNLFLTGGGTGKVYYNGDNTDATKEVATLGDIAGVATGFNESPGRKEFAGNASLFDLPTTVLLDSVQVSINGLELPSTQFTINSTSKIATFTGLSYTLDSVDRVVFTYLRAA